jgi:tetratricopeptide (TPR) repeat protein
MGNTDGAAQPAVTGKDRSGEVRNRRACLGGGAACAALLLVIGCSPALVGRQDLNRNPVEIIEESPRIYQIRFEHFADSLETARVANYLSGTVPFALYIPEDVGDIQVSRADSAIMEYRKAVKRLDAGAGPAGLEHIKRAIELDPTFLPSYVVLARIFMDDGQILRAKDLLEQVLARNPTDSEALVELGKCDMYIGEFEKARKALIDAVIFERTNLDAWGELKRLGSVDHFEVATRDAPELAFVEKARGRHLDMIIDSSLVDCPLEASAWLVFASQRAVWKYEGKYQQKYGRTRYEKTYDEDVDCYLSLAVAWQVLTEHQDSVLSADSSVCDSEYLDFLAEVSDQGHLVSHVLMDYICLESPGAARHFPAEVIDRMREYMEKFVLIRNPDGS